MALIGCEQWGSTEPRSKSGPPSQEIALFFHSSPRTLMACQKKFFLEKRGDRCNVEDV